MSKMIFETQRLFVRRLEENDHLPFFEMMSDPRVMDLIPQKVFNEASSNIELARLMSVEKLSDTKIWSLCKKENKEMIGICGLLKNDEKQDEIAYRLLEKFWGKGYGTEITKGLIEYCFTNMNSDLVTADVWVENIRSVKILEKYFTAQKEFFNAHDNCTDRRYVLKKENDNRII
jgi:ribosomal-protein-alanine N-acetyltransferase